MIDLFDIGLLSFKLARGSRRMDLDVKEKRLQRLLIGLIISFISMFIVLIFANFLFFFVIEQVLLYSIRLLELSFLFHPVGAIVIEELVTRLVELELLSR